ncbi:MAG: hypothetical protein IKF19_02200 [Bacilli bacterium]|nr:hypothetical protein [Bacilli bacterium]
MSINSIRKTPNYEESDWLETYYKQKWSFNKKTAIFEVVVLLTLWIISLLNGKQHTMFYIIFSMLCFMMIIAQCKIFLKAKMKWWYTFIPGYDLYCMFKIAFGEGLYILLAFIPFVNIVVYFMFWYKLAKSFGKSTLFSIISILFGIITIQIIAFDDSKYTRI